MSIYLIIETDDNKGRVRLTSKTLILGRSSSCNIKVEDPLVSSKHLAIKTNPSGHAIIKDLGSTNGTYLNNSYVTDSLLYLGDVIKIGEVQMYLDESAMSQIERKIHLNSERKKVNYLDLKEKKTSEGKFRNLRGLTDQFQKDNLCSDADDDLLDSIERDDDEDRKSVV